MTQAPERPPLDRPLELPPRAPDAPRRRLPSLDDLVDGRARRPSDRPALTQRTARYVRTWVRRHRVSLVVLSSLLVVVGIVHGAGLSRMPLPVDDEGTYMAQAWAVQVRHALTPYTYWYDHPPLGWIQLAGWTFVTHAFSGATLAIVAGRRIMLLYALADAALLYLIARRLRLSRVWAAVAVLAFALSPLAVNYQRMVLLDNLAMPWLLAAFALALTPRRRLWTFGASGACFAVAVLSKETMLLFLPALVYQVWQRSHRTTRAFCVTALVSVFGLLVAVYPLLALLKNELVPGPGHVSLSSAIAFQLNGRQGTGNPFNATSQAHSLVTGWLHLDPWLPVAGLVCLPVGLCVRRLRPLAVAELIALLDVLRGGYLPVPFVIGILPFAALLLAGTGSTLQGLVRWTPGRRPWAVVEGGVLVGLAGALLVFVVPAWASGLRTQMATDQVTPTVQAESWVEQHVPRTDRLLVDDTVWVDLVDHGFNRPYGVVWFYKLGSVNNLDPSVRRTLGGGWRGFQYVLVTPSMREALLGSGTQALPQVAQAVAHSVPVASFGSGVDTIMVRRVSTSTRSGGSHTTAPPPTPPTRPTARGSTSATNSTKAGSHK
ncbi:MAG TPA: glycosyltransferase family 39 protein [Acidimicrobiales bacterium]